MSQDQRFSPGGETQLSQQLLEESTNRLKAALNAAQMGMWDWNLVTGEVNWSPEHEQLFGLAVGSFDGKYETFEACLHPDDRDGLTQAIAHTLNHQVPYQHEFRIIWSDDSVHWMEGRGQAFYRDGVPILMSGTVMAIDERKQAQLLLNQQVERQRLMMEMTQRIRQSLNLQEILQTTVDEVCQFLQVDRVLIFEFTPEWGGAVTFEAVVDNAFAILPFDICDPCIESTYIEVFKNGGFTAKADIYTADIHPCHVEFLAQFQVRANLVVPILKNGELWGLLAAHHCTGPRQWQMSEIELLQYIAAQAGIALQQAMLLEQAQRELAERQQTEAKLKERESLLQLFAQYAPAGIAMLDREMRYLMASQQWVDEYQLGTVTALLNQSHYDIFPEIPEHWRQIHQRCLAGAIEKCNEELFVRADGTQQWLMWEIRPWYTMANEVGGIVIFSVDITQRKQVELALQESQEKLQLFIQYAPASIVMFDRQMCYLTASRRWADDFHVSSIGSLVGRSHYELFPDLDERLKQSHQRGLSGMIEKCDEELFVHVDGTQEWFRWEVHPWYHHSGEIGGILLFSENITERKQAEANLRQSEARLRLAQVASNSAVWDWDILTNTLAWSPEYYQLYGLESDREASYETWLSCIHPDDRERASQQTLQALHDAASQFRVEFRIRRLNDIRWFAGIGQVLCDQSGEPIRMIGITIDITQQKQTEIALQHLNTELEQRVEERTTELTALNQRLLRALKDENQAKQEVELLYNNAPCGYHSLDADGTIIRINDTELNWLGYSRDQVINQMKFVDCITPDSRDVFYQNFPQFIQQGWINNLEFQLCQKDGLTRWVSLSSTAMKDEVGNFVMSLTTLFDISDRKQTEQIMALQAVITRNMAEGICLVRTDDATIVYANPKFEQMFGYDPGELNGRHVAIVNYPNDAMTPEEVYQSIQAAVLQNNEFDYEVHNIRKDGTPFWCRAACSVFQHPEYGDVLVAVQQDITARKQAEAALQQQARQKQLLWAITQAIRQSLDLPTILKSAVTEVRDLLGVERAAIYRFNPNWSGDFIIESVAEGWLELVDPATCKIWEDTYLQEHQGGRFRQHETLMVADIYAAGLKDCHIELLEQFQARAYAIAPIFVGDVLWGLFAIYHNATPHDWETWEIELLQQITDQLAIAIQQAELYNQLQLELQERQQAEAILQEAERRWRSLLDKVQLLVVGLDQSGCVNYVNPFFLRVTGYADSEVLGKNWFDHFLPTSSAKTMQSVFSDVLACGAHPYYESGILTKAGEERFIGWNNATLQDLNGSAIGTISIGEDITEQQKVEQIKNEFIGIVSHELRTPLTSIQMSLGLMQSGIYAKRPEKTQRMIEIALLDTSRLVNLVNDILDLERLESGRTVVEKLACQAADLMQQAVDGVQALATRQAIQLRIMPTKVTVWAAPDMILQTLTNLLGNAIKFSPAHAVITLQAERQANGILFQVQDQGRGIPEDKLETIFGRFQQVDATDSREKGGTGLGLSICRSIIERHSGKIWAESIPGAGSTFFFTLPLPAEENL